MGKRVLSAMIKHETNTFSHLATGLNEYRTHTLRSGNAREPVYRGTRSELAAHFDVAKEHGWELVCAIAANATSSGRVTAEAYDYLCGTVFAALDRDGPFDGVLLALHGSMVTETTDDGEGTLLAAIRERVGPDIPICVSLDLHANVTDLMAASASGLFSFRTYPRIDTYETAMRAAGVLRDAMDGRISPRCLVARRAMIEGANQGRSQDGPMVELVRRCLEYGKEPGILDVSVNAGFPWADIEQAGPTVTVTYDGASDRARAIAEAMMDTVWEERDNVTLSLMSAADAMARLRELGAGDKPVILADFSDNPGGGAYGDDPTLLAAMIEAGLKNAAFGTMVDPEAVILCQRAGVRGTVTLPLGGKVDPALAPPLTVTGEVVAISEGSFTQQGPLLSGLRSSMGSAAILRVDSIDVIISSARLQTMDQAVFRSQGIEPSEKAVVAVKSAHHFRADFGPIAREVLIVDGQGLASPDLGKFQYRNVRRPVWPLDPV
jgi:microcystin degradation protein MlrC